MTTGQGPVKAPLPRSLKVERTAARLRQSLWEMSQYASRTEIGEYVGKVLDEIEEDE